jgi:hypothetical protein
VYPQGRGGRAAGALLVHDRQGAFGGQALVVDDDLAEGVQARPVVEFTPGRKLQLGRASEPERRGDGEIFAQMFPHCRLALLAWSSRWRD